MTMFWIISAVMLLAAIWFVISALFGKTNLGDADQNKQNIAIAKEQLAIIEQEKNTDQISEAEYLQRKEELQQGLVDNVDNAEKPLMQNGSPKFLFLLTVIIVPLISVSSYSYLGRSDAVLPQSVVSQHTGGSQHAEGAPMSMDEALKTLSAKLKKNPENIKGWQMLGRSYMSLNRYKEAAEAYENLYRQVGDEVPVLLAYADALAMSRNGQISGLPFQLVKTALAKDPKNTTALWLAGLGHSENGEFENAINSWQQLLPLISGNPSSESKIRNLIAQANTKLDKPVAISPITPAKTKKEATGPASLQVTVTLDDSLKNSVKPDDIVFIYAKAHTGPPMPLAAVRQSVASLPVTVTLDDSMAMMPQMKLSSFSVVDVGARISKSGSAIGQKGDLEGVVESVDVNKAQEIGLVINSIKP